MNNEKQGLREGYTTGTCAAAATKGAAYGIVNGYIPDFVEVQLPSGKSVKLQILQKITGHNFAECCVKKDAGDDPDVTHGALIFARVEQVNCGCFEKVDGCQPGNYSKLKSKPESRQTIQIDGGKGVGVVTKPGLQVAIGRPAINPVPQEMIRKSVLDVIGEEYRYDIRVVISVPDGEMIAKRTFNERLGICGGISIIGTTGIVKPMSEEAIKVSLKCELDVAKASGFKTVILAPGNLAENAVKKNFDLKNGQVVLMSNFVGYMLGEAYKLAFSEVIIAGHPGKLAKLLRGDFNTHSSKSEPANDLIIDILKNEDIENEIIKCSMESTTVEGIIREVKKSAKFTVFDKIAGMVEKAASGFLNDKLRIGVILFDMEKEVVGMSLNAQKWKDSVTFNKSCD